MRNDKHLAIKLRQQGKSYSKISQELSIPKSTLCCWLSSQPWSQELKYELTKKAIYVAKKRLRLYNKSRREYWEAWREKARQEARAEFPSKKDNQLFLSAIMLYWSEGDSKLENGCVRLTNTDPVMIKIFSRFLQEICSIPKEKIRLYIILYPDLKELECKKYWSNITDIPANQFVKTQYIQGRHPTKRLEFGVCIIHIASRQLKEKINIWIQLYKDELMRV